MNEDCLKLTTYFGERDRADEAFVADVLLELYGRHELQTSVLLRGAAGFGLKHRLRTDRLLTLSEDLPLISVAVDTRERIERILPEVAEIKRRGLITLERARMLTGSLPPTEMPEDLHEATKLTVYVGRKERVYGMPAFEAVCELLHRRDIAGATVLLGVDGTSNGVRERARFFGGNPQVPLMIIAIGDGHRIAGVLPELGGMLHRPLVRVRVCKRDGQLRNRPHELPDTDEHGLALWQKLMIYTSEQAHHDGRPIHTQILERLRRAGAAGATTVRGIWGFHGDHAPHGDRFLQLRRRVPVVTIVVDTPQRIAASFDIIDELTSRVGLVTSEMVPAMASLTEQERRGGLRLASHRF